LFAGFKSLNKKTTATLPSERGNGAKAHTKAH